MSPLSTFNHLFAFSAAPSFKLSSLLQLATDGSLDVYNSMLYGAEAFASFNPALPYDDRNYAPAKLQPANAQSNVIARITPASSSTSASAPAGLDTPVTSVSRPALPRSSTSSTSSTSTIASFLSSPSSIFSADDAISSVSSASSIGDDTLFNQNQCEAKHPKTLEHTRVLVPDESGEVDPFYDSDDEDEDEQYLSADQMYREHLQELDMRRVRGQEQVAEAAAALQNDINLLFEGEGYESDAVSVTNEHISSLTNTLDTKIKGKNTKPQLPAAAPACTFGLGSVGLRTASLAKDEVYLFYDSEEEDESFNMDAAYVEHLAELERRRRFGLDEHLPATVVKLPPAPRAGPKQDSVYPGFRFLGHKRLSQDTSNSTFAHLASIFSLIGHSIQQ